VIALREELVAALLGIGGPRGPEADPADGVPRRPCDRFGSDKPDLRFGLEITDLTGYFAYTPFRVFQAPYVGAIVQPGGADTPRRGFDAWQEWAKQRGAKGLAYVTVGTDEHGRDVLSGPVARNISDQERAGLAAAVGCGSRRRRVLRRRRADRVAGVARCRPAGDRAPRLG
jgi:aspartyl-tRNA synthetase